MGMAWAWHRLGMGLRTMRCINKHDCAHGLHAECEAWSSNEAAQAVPSTFALDSLGTEGMKGTAHGVVCIKISGVHQ